MDLNEIRNLLPGDRNYFLESVTIVSPYLSWSFIEELVDMYGDDDPDFKINFIIDQNCPRSSIDEVRENITEEYMGSFRISRTSGLVHAKLYWFDFYRMVNNRKKHRKIFVFGSLNATKGGWEKNSEVSAAVNLYSQGRVEEREQLNNYFIEILNNDDVAGQQVIIGDTTIYLPAMRLEDFQEEEPPSDDISFDNWLQKGILAHAYKNERFARFEVKLLAPPQGNINVPGWDIQETRTISYGYTDVLDVGGRGEQWRSRYFIDTIYGSWSSFDCYSDYGDDFVRGGSETRAGHLEYIKKIGVEVQIQNVVTNCMNALQDLFQNEQIEPLLRKTADGVVDIDYYRHNCLQQIEKHIRKANDPVFEERYVNGFEFNELPPLLECEALLREFLESLFETMLYGIRSRGDQNPMGLFARVVKDALELDGDEEWQDVYNDVVELWNDNVEFKESLISYYYEEE